MKKWQKIILGLSITVLVLIISISIFSYFILVRNLPDYNDEIISVKIKNQIEIYRDSNAVPFIFAIDDEDAAFALGYVHAQDRMFQMDLMRRAGQGRLSEIFGSSTVPFDRMFRTIGIYKSVEENYHKLSELSKRMLISYSAGVNQYLYDKKGDYSAEFDILGYLPYKWKPEHSLVIAKMMAWELNISWWTDIAFIHLIQKLGEEKVREIIPDYQENAPTIIPKEIKNYSAVNLDFIKTDKAFRKFIGFNGTHIGSNNWVVNGIKSKSGKPIIANDPHLAFQIPGKWFVASVKSDSWNAAGFTLPGLPGIVIGKNENISWVLTNVMADDADFYLEKFDSTKTKYLFEGEWKNLTKVTDTIIVKDSIDVVFNKFKTHRGPIISDIHPYNYLYKNEFQNDLTISMRWSALDFSDELFAVQKINRANDWNEFKEGVKDFTVPGQNFVYADKFGNIGYICAAKLPVRNLNSPSILFDGTTSAYDWKGYVPFEEMPKLFNPSENFIASANNKTVSNFKYHISNIWEPSSRIERINELLTQKQMHSVDDYKNYQMDFYSHYSKKIVPFILQAFEDVKIMDENLKKSLELLSKFDFVIDKESQTPTIYLVFYQFLLQNIFEDEMGIELFQEYKFIANVPYRKIEEMLELPYNSWFDNINTQEFETRDDIIRESLVDALAFLEKKLGRDLTYWQWGKIHKVEFKHIFGEVSEIAGMLLNVGPYEIGGDGTTVFNTEYSFNKPYENKLGPSMRYIYDFSNENYFEYVLPNGQSGHFLSDYYSNMTDKWLNGSYNKVYFNKETIKKNSKYLMILNTN